MRYDWLTGYVGGVKGQMRQRSPGELDPLTLWIVRLIARLYVRVRG